MTGHPKQAMVLAAGLGKRLRPLTDRMPKPLVPVAGRSMLDRALDRLVEAGVEQAIVNVSYKAEMLEAHLATRATPRIVFSREAEPLETGGGIAKAIAHFGTTPFYAVNGDIIWLDTAGEYALKRLAEAWSDDIDALLLVQRRENATGYEGAGDFDMDERGRLARRKGNAAAYVYAGVQMLHPRLFAQCPPGAFSLNVLYDRILNSDPPRIRGLAHRGDWLHVGDLQGLALAQERLARRPG